MRHITVLALSLLAAGCGDYSKDPVPDLEKMRQNGKVELQKGPDKPRVITNQVLVEKPIIETKEVSAVDKGFVVITPDSHMTFNEGQTGQFKIQARSLVPGIQIKLKASGFPEGAQLEKSKTEKDVYTLTWTPALYTIASNASMKDYSVKVTAEVISAENKTDIGKLNALVQEKEFSLFLFKNQEAPSGLAVSGIPTEIAEGTLTSFYVTVKVPGTNNKAPQKPLLVVSYDGVSYTAGNNFLELDGSRYVVADLNKKEPEYLGDSKWKFTLVFDTKNISVQPQLGKDGNPLANADGTRVRLSFKVYSPYGPSTPQVLTQVKIRFQKPVTPSNKPKPVAPAAVAESGSPAKSDSGSNSNSHSTPDSTAPDSVLVDLPTPTQPEPEVKK